MANCFRRPSTMVPATPRSEAEILQSANLKGYTLEDLKTATMNFRSDGMLGEGRFGLVYKGWVDETTFAPDSSGTGMPVAIKLNEEGFQGHKDWLAEVHHLGQLSHPNLVKLLGYCAEDECHLLVYEFMPQGSLENHLFMSRGSHFQPLSWDLRMKVALGAARGLAFLHSDKANVIYGDFRTSNILLDSSYNAKLSDFGLLSDGPIVDPGFYIDELASYKAKRLSDLGLSTGNTDDATAESDVYNFGVVLLEILSGRRGMDRNRPASERDLVEWARPYLKSKRQISHILDAQLGRQYSVAEAQKTGALALQCLSGRPKVRPGMEQVVAVLEQLQHAKETAASCQGKVAVVAGGSSRCRLGRCASDEDCKGRR